MERPGDGRSAALLPGRFQRRSGLVFRLIDQHDAEAAGRRQKDDAMLLQRLAHGVARRVAHVKSVRFKPLQGGQGDQSRVRQHFLRPAEERPRRPYLPGCDHR